MKRNKEKVVADSISGILILASILAYIILGITIAWWHPGWVVIVSAVIVSGIIEIIVNAHVKLTNKEEEKPQQPKKFKDM